MLYAQNALQAASFQSVNRDPQLFYWILIPISIVMVLTGVLRHYANSLLQAKPKAQSASALREQRALFHGINLRTNHPHLSSTAFNVKKEHTIQAFKEGTYLRDPEKKEGSAANPLSDPAAMEGMMGMLKGNMMTMIPQTLIMSWINAFFAGFVVLRLPFPLTIRFKQMLQAGILTQDMDVRWVSSLSWYFLNIFGLQSVFIYILGNDNAASQTAAQIAQMNTGNVSTSPFQQPGQEQNKMFHNEAENLEVIEHWSVYDSIDVRLNLQID